MPDRNRDDRRDTRPRHRSDEPKQREEKKPLALTFVSISYDPAHKQLVAVVQATKGSKPVEAVNMQLLVPPTQIGTGQTDANGQATFTVDVHYPPKTYPLVAKTIGTDLVQTSSAFVVPQPYELTEYIPAVDFDATVDLVDDHYVVVLDITAKRGSSPVVGELVRIDYDDGDLNSMETTTTELDGSTQKRLRIPENGRKKIDLSVKMRLPNLLNALPCARVIHLKPPTGRPFTMSWFTRTLDESLGWYELVQTIEDEAKNPVKGVRLMAGTDHGKFASGTGQKCDEVTDADGVSTFAVFTSPDHDLTDFPVDCPGILNNAKYCLPKPQKHNRYALRYLPTHVGEAMLIGIALCILYMFFSLLNLGISYFNHPAVADIQIPTVQALRSPAEQAVYQNPEATRVDTVKNGADTFTVQGSDTTWLSAHVREDAPSVTSFLTTLKILATCLVIAIICLAIAIPLKLQALQKMAMLAIRVRMSGVADNNPGLTRIATEHFLAPHAAPAAPAAAGATPAPVPVAAPAAHGGGLTSHLPAVALFGIMDLIVDRFLDVWKGRSSKK